MDPDARDELDATLAARRELGPAHDSELVEGFLDRIDGEIERRVDARVAQQAPHQSALHPGNLAVCIPIVVVAGIFGGALGIVAVVAALVIIFAIDSRR